MSIVFALFAQSTKGLTEKRDTSYTSLKAYNDIKKSHPQVKIAWISGEDSARLKIAISSILPLNPYAAPSPEPMLAPGDVNVKVGL